MIELPTSLQRDVLDPRGKLLIIALNKPEYSVLKARATS